MDSFKPLLDQSSSLLILIPQNPSLDSVAGGLALYLSLKGRKEAIIASPSPMLVEFNRLVGVDKISQELGNKNLVIKFADYKAANIERVSYDIEKGEFRLTVIPKEGMSAPEKDQINASYSGVSGDLVVLVGGVNEGDFPALSLKELETAKIVHVGNTQLSNKSDRVLSLERSASSMSEAIGFLLKESGLEVDADIATNLLAGIEAGTNNLTNPLISADTFQMIADLMKMGGRRMSASTQSMDFPMGAIPESPFDINPEEETIPDDWVGPKVFKGTTVN